MATDLNSNPVAEAARRAEAGTFSLMVVDDTEANRDALSRRLQRRGYTVATASDGAEALALIDKRSFDLILLDIMMPGLNGFEVLEVLRRTHPATELPVIMATAKDASEDIVRALDLGASDYVTKPFDFAVVLARVRTHLSLKRAVQQTFDLEQRLSLRNAELEASNTHMKRDLTAAARIQEAFLPRSLPTIPGMNFAWAFRPCEALAGDFLNVCPLDADHVGAYVLDVSGHGVAAALLSVTLTRVLSPATDPSSFLVRAAGDPAESRIVPPAEVADRLNQKFPFDPATEQYFTIHYGLVNVKTGEYRYVSAGHPGAVHMRPGEEPTVLEGCGLPIGLGGGYEQYAMRLDGGDRLYLYSDGVTESMNADGKLFGGDRLKQAIRRGSSAPLQESIALLLGDIQNWRGAAPILDDVSVLALERL